MVIAPAVGGGGGQQGLAELGGSHRQIEVPSLTRLPAPDERWQEEGTVGGIFAGSSLPRTWVAPGAEPLAG